MIYQYESIVLSNPNYIEEINQWAANGWRLVTIVVDTTGWTPIYVAYFERPVE